jgi:hypothetical protein
MGKTLSPGAVWKFDKIRLAVGQGGELAFVQRIELAGKKRAIILDLHRGRRRNQGKLLRQGASLKEEKNREC